MSEIVDLDKLVPEPKKVKLSGKILDVYPGKIKALIRIQKAFASFKDAGEDEKLDLMDRVVTALAEIIPGIKEEDVDISMEQLPVLVNLAYQTSSNPAETPLAEKNDMTVKADGEKKTTSPEQSPISLEDSPATS